MKCYTIDQYGTCTLVVDEANNGGFFSDVYAAEELSEIKEEPSGVDDQFAIDVHEAAGRLRFQSGVAAKRSARTQGLLH